jgi:hypothetical protein
VYREKVIACERGGTYKYFLDRDEVMPTWERLKAAFGDVQRNETMATIEVRGRALIVRSTLLGNPLTVFRRPPCTATDVEAFHTLIGFSE